MAALSDIDYELVRQDQAKQLGFRLTFLDKIVMKTRAANAGAVPDPGVGRHFEPIEPWPEAVDGGELLDELVEAFKAHVVMSPEETLAAALWVLHCHMHDAATISPLLAITSPTPGCGKSTMLGVLRNLTPKALPAANITPAATFRVIEACHPTLLVDEGDAFLAGREELRGILDAGYEKHGPPVIRCVKGEIKQFEAWCPKAIAQIKSERKALPPTLQDRSIEIRLRKKLRAEKITRFRADRVQHLKNIRRRAARWTADNLEMLRARDAPVPQKIANDRAADNWRTLLNIADVIGGKWPAKARAAALAMENVAGEPDAKHAPGIRLLADVKIFFETCGAEALSAADIIAGICSVEESPWANYRFGKQISEMAFAQLLKPFGISSKQITSGRDKGKKRWHRADFADAWKRYLPPEGDFPLKPLLR